MVVVVVVVVVSGDKVTVPHTEPSWSTARAVAEAQKLKLRANCSGPIAGCVAWAQDLFRAGS